MADIGDEEFAMMKGQPMNDPKVLKEIDVIPMLRLEIPSKPVPENLDWRQYGMYNQGVAMVQ